MIKLDVSSNVLARTFDLSTSAKPYKLSAAAQQPNALDGSGSAVTLKISQNAKAAAPKAMSLQNVIDSYAAGAPDADAAFTTADQIASDSATTARTAEEAAQAAVAAATLDPFDQDLQAAVDDALAAAYQARADATKTSADAVAAGKAREPARADAAAKNPFVLVDSLDNIQKALKSLSLDVAGDGKSDLQRLADAGVLFDIRSTKSPSAAGQVALDVTAAQLSDANLYSKLAGAKLNLTEGEGDLKGLDMASAQLLLKQIQKGTLTGVTSLSISDTGANIQNNLKTLSALGAKLGTVSVTNEGKVPSNFKLTVDQALNFGAKLRGEAGVPPTLTVADTASHIEAKLSDLNSLNPDTLKVLGGSLHLGVNDVTNDADLLMSAQKGGLRRIEIKGDVTAAANAKDDLGSLSKNFKVDLRVSGSATEVGSKWDDLESLAKAGLLTNVSVTGDDKNVAVSIAALVVDSHVATIAARGGAKFAVSDTVENITAGLDNLQGMLKKRLLSNLSSVTATDAPENNTPVEISVSATQLSKDADAISLLSQSVNLQVNLNLDKRDNRVHTAAMAYDAGMKFESAMVSTLTGTAGNDLIAAGLARDVTINGGGGMDTALLAGALEDYTVSIQKGDADIASDDPIYKSVNANLKSGIMEKTLTYKFFNLASQTTVTANAFTALAFHDQVDLPWDSAGRFRPVNIKA